MGIHKSSFPTTREEYKTVMETYVGAITQGITVMHETRNDSRFRFISSKSDMSRENASKLALRLYSEGTPLVGSTDDDLITYLDGQNKCANLPVYDDLEDDCNVSEYHNRTLREQKQVHSAFNASYFGSSGTPENLFPNVDSIDSSQLFNRDLNSIEPDPNFNTIIQNLISHYIGYKATDGTYSEKLKGIDDMFTKSYFNYLTTNFH